MEDEVENRSFRQNLYYRLHVVPLTVPPLPNRLDELTSLGKRFVQRFHRDNTRSPKAIVPSVIPVRQSYNWPGNIRQLKNIIERLLIRVPRDVILIDDVAAVLPVPRDSENGVGRLRISPLFQANRSLQHMVDEAEASFVL